LQELLVILIETFVTNIRHQHQIDRNITWRLKKDIVMVRFGKAGLKSIESLPEPFFTPETRLKPNEKIYFIKVDRLNAITSVAIQSCNGSQVNAIRMVFRLIT